MSPAISRRRRLARIEEADLVEVLDEGIQRVDVQCCAELLFGSLPDDVERRFPIELLGDEPFGLAEPIEAAGDGMFDNEESPVGRLQPANGQIAPKSRCSGNHGPGALPVTEYHQAPELPRAPDGRRQSALRAALVALGPVALGPVALGPVALGTLAARAMTLAALRAAATTTGGYGPRRNALLELLELENQVLHTSLPLKWTLTSPKADRSGAESAALRNRG